MTDIADAGPQSLNLVEFNFLGKILNRANHVWRTLAPQAGGAEKAQWRWLESLIGEEFLIATGLCGHVYDR